MNELTKAVERSNGVISLAHTQAMRLKQAGALVDMTPSMGGGQLFGIRDNSADRQRYTAFRGWLYAAVNAIAQEAAGQPVHLGRMMDEGTEEEELGEERMRRPRGQKSWMRERMTQTMRTKTADQEMEVLLNHPLLDVLEQPNPVQRRWQFVYNFIANLNLTGWSYVVGGPVEGGGVEFYCLPTTWVIPDHTKGPFAEFRIHNPKNPLGEVDQKPLTRDQVAFAYLPNPADPLGAMAPAQSQMNSIRIDDYIQSSQERFFENGIFPSVIVTVGKQPHPDVPAGVTPLLTGAQRRQIHTAIGRAMRGVANYGNPAILDGLIERIDRLSMGQNEMGWEKSEQAVRTRILSAFGVHPYILGEPVNVGGYAQAAKIEERFCKRVNTFLDMLGCVMTSFVGPLTSVEDDLVIWWEQTEPHDPSLHWQNIRYARDRDDITQNEYRAMLGLPPDEDRNESVIGSQAAQVVQLLVQVGNGAVDREQAMAFLEGMGLPSELADRIAGKQKEKQEVAQATETLQEAVRALQLDPKQLVSQIERSLKYNPSQPRVPAGSGAGGEFAGGGSGGGGGGSAPSGGGGGGKDQDQTYKQEYKRWEKNLSDHERESLSAYTGEHYSFIKQCLNEGVGCNGQLKSYIEGLSSCLKKAPGHEGEVYRGLAFKTADERNTFLAGLEKNEGFVGRGFVSTTRSRGRANKYASGEYFEYPANQRNPVILKIMSKKGVDISRFSDYPQEREVLFNLSTKFKMTNRVKEGRSIVVSLEEVG